MLRMTRAPLSLSGLWVLEDKVRCTLKAIGNMEVWCAVVAVMGDKTSDLGALCQWLCCRHQNKLLTKS